MSEENIQPAERAAALRQAFDRSFAQASRVEDAMPEDLLGIRIGNDPYAVRLAEIGGLFTGRVVTPLPNTTTGLLGIAGFRGAIVPVYDLRALLDYPAGGTPHWMMLAARAPVALAFDTFDGHLRLAREAIVPRTLTANSLQQYVREVLQTADRARPIVDLDSVLDSIRRRAPKGVLPQQPPQEG